jgi:WD40 repeat protein
VVRDTTSGSPVAVFGPQPTHVKAIDWSPDGLGLVSIGEREPVDRWSYPPFAKVWSRASGQLVQDIPAYESPAFFAPDGTRIFIGEEDTVMAWCHAEMQ